MTTKSRPARYAILSFVCAATFGAGGTGYGTENIAGTARIYTVTEAQACAAITNAFSSLRYHETMLIPAHYDTAGRVWTSEPATNEWMLYTGTTPVAMVTRGNTVLPYFAEFDIKTQPLGANAYQIFVRTTSSWVHDGKEPGVHGGWAAHAKHIPPVQQEETNVQLQIEGELRRVQQGREAAPVQRRKMNAMSSEEEAAFSVALRAAATNANSPDGNDHRDTGLPKK